MVTTALFVEILVIGTLAEIWIGLLLASTLPVNFPWSSFLASLEGTAALLAVPFLALTYSLGWIINFLGERVFKLLAQRRIRDHAFQKVGVDYEVARALVFQKGAEDALEELRFGRHIIRLARSSCLQLPLIAAGLLQYVKQAQLTVSTAIALLLALAVASFFQWLSRYRSQNRRLLELYFLLTDRTPVPEALEAKTDAA